MLIWLVNKKDVEEMPYVLDDWCAEVSALGIPPGIWPERIRTDDLGDGTDFIDNGWSTDREDVRFYVQPNTRIELHIFNDWEN